MTHEEAARFWFAQWQISEADKNLGWIEARRLAMSLRSLPTYEWAEKMKAESLTKYQQAVDAELLKSDARDFDIDKNIEIQNV